MSIDINIASTPQDFEKLRDIWKDLAHEVPGSMLGLDATAGFEWFEATCAAFPEAADARVIVASDGSNVLGLLPVICAAKRMYGSELVTTTELYGGRCGLLLRQYDRPEIVQALLAGLGDVFPGWCSIKFTLVQGSPSANSLERACSQLGFNTLRGSAAASPFFPILESEDEFFKGISKDVRNRLKISRKRLIGLGEVEFKGDDDGGDVSELLSDVLAIERQTWKHEQGSAITNNENQANFYRELFPRLHRARQLRVEIMYLGGAPIGYMFGILRDGVFSDLKSSHISSLERVTPGHFLKLQTINQVRSQGAHTYDFMGLTESHKLRWSNSTALYQRYPLRVFSRNVGGRLTFYGSRAKQRLSKSTDSSRPATVTAPTEHGSD